ncbi:MAG: hypothetical protein HY369_01570 [Candidatus Aenigmarchaeota archaeon]|nr:hypothetical protein [Candidatus Aenigmarchaeota archaeon]
MQGDWVCHVTGRSIPAPRGNRRCRVCAGLGGRCLAAVRLRRGERRLGGGKSLKKPRPLSWGTGRTGTGADGQDARPAGPRPHGRPDASDQPATPAKDELDAPEVDDADVLKADRAFYRRDRGGRIDDPDGDRDGVEEQDDNYDIDDDDEDDAAARPAATETEGEGVDGAREGKDDGNGDDDDLDLDGPLPRTGGTAGVVEPRAPNAADVSRSAPAGEAWPLPGADREPDAPRDSILGWDCAALDRLGDHEPGARGAGDHRPLGGPLDFTDDDLDDPLDGDDLTDGPEGPVAA